MFGPNEVRCELPIMRVWIDAFKSLTRDGDAVSIET